MEQTGFCLRASSKIHLYPSHWSHCPFLTKSSRSFGLPKYSLSKSFINQVSPTQALKAWWLSQLVPGSGGNNSSSGIIFFHRIWLLEIFHFYRGRNLHTVPYRPGYRTKIGVEAEHSFSYITLRWINLEMIVHMYTSNHQDFTV